MARKEKDENDFESCYWLYEKQGKVKYYMIYTDNPEIKKEIRKNPFSRYSDGGTQWRVKEGCTDYNKFMTFKPLEYELADLQRKEGKS